MASKSSRETLIHCENCGEEYSSTYRRCPFCGERNDPRRTTPRNDPVSSSRYIPTPPPAKPAPARDEEPEDDGYVFDGQDAFDGVPEEDGDYAPARPKGGKRLAPKEGGRGLDLPDVNWPRLITFLCSLVIIVAALIIVFTVIYPQVRGAKKNPDAQNSSQVSAPPSAAPTPSQDIAPTPSQDVEPSDSVPPGPVGQTATVVGASGGLNVRSGPGTGNRVVSSLANGDSVTVLAEAEGGWYQISCAKNGATIQGYVLGTYLSIGGASTEPPVVATPTPTPTPTASGGNVTVGRPGVVTGASGGLNVRSGPGTSYNAVASLVNGNALTVLEAAGGGWYKISFLGVGGVTLEGYVLGDYISTN